MAPTINDQDMAETEELINAHPIDDIFLIDMSEVEMEPEALDFDIVMMVDTLLIIMKHLVDDLFWVSVVFIVLIHAFYATIPRILPKPFASRFRLLGISYINILNGCNNSSELMNCMLVHITTPESLISGMDRRYTSNNVLLCGLLSNHISTVLAREGSGRRHLLLLKLLNYGVQRLEYEFGDAARLFNKLDDCRREELGPPWPFLEEMSDDFHSSKWIYENFCFRLLCHASFDECAGIPGDIASHGARNIASHDSLNVQYLVRHVIFSTVMTQDYSVLYASGGDISCLEMELVTVLRQNSQHNFPHMREILHKHIRAKLDGEPDPVRLKNLKVIYLLAAATKLELKFKKKGILVYYRSAKTGDSYLPATAKKKTPKRHTSGTKRDILVRNEHCPNYPDDRMIAVVGHELTVFKPTYLDSLSVQVLWARLQPDGFIIKDRILVGTYFGVVTTALAVAIWQTSEALSSGRLSGIDITSAASLYLVVIGIVTTIFKTTRAVEWSWYDFIRMQHKSKIINFTHEERCVTYGEVIALAASRDENDKHAMLGPSNLCFLPDHEFTGSVNLPWAVPIGALITNGFLLLQEYSTGELLLVATTRDVYGANRTYDYSDNARVFICKQITRGICHVVEEVDSGSKLFGPLGFAGLRVGWDGKEGNKCQELTRKSLSNHLRIGTLQSAGRRFSFMKGYSLR